MQMIQEVASDFRRKADELRYVPQDFLRVLKNNWLALFGTLVLAVALNRILLWGSVALTFIHPILSTLTLPFAAIAIMSGAIVAIWIIEKDLVHLKFAVPEENRFRYLLHSTGALILPFIAIYLSTGWDEDDFIDRRMPLIELRAGSAEYFDSLQVDPSYDERSTIVVFCAAVVVRMLLRWSGLGRKNLVCAWILAYCEVLWAFTLATWLKNFAAGEYSWPQQFHFWDWWESGKDFFSGAEPLKEIIGFLFSTVLVLPVSWIIFVQLVLRKSIILDENSPFPKTRDEWAVAPQLASRQTFTFLQASRETVLLLFSIGPFAVALLCFYFNLFWVPENLWRWLLDLIFGPITAPGPRFYIKYSLLPFGKVLALAVITVLSCVTADRCQGSIINRLRKPQWT